MRQEWYYLHQPFPGHRHRLPWDCSRFVASPYPSICTCTLSLTSTGLLAGLYSYGIGPGECYTPPSDPSKLFLTVEYTRSALTALVVFQECRLYDVKRVLHETGLGVDNLSKEPSSDYRIKLEKALRDLTRQPVKTRRWSP